MTTFNYKNQSWNAELGKTISFADFKETFSSYYKDEEEAKHIYTNIGGTIPKAKAKKENKDE